VRLRVRSTSTWLKRVCNGCQAARKVSSTFDGLHATLLVGSVAAAAAAQ
jgi:hypothetical protein